MSESRNATIGNAPPELEHVHRVSRLVVAVAMIVVSLVGVAGPVWAGSYYSSYNPCPWDKPYQHTNAYGNTYCSAYP